MPSTSTESCGRQFIRRSWCLRPPGRPRGLLALGAGYAIRIRYRLPKSSINSNGVIVSFARLHSQHAMTRLLRSLAPPRASGVQCSTCSLAGRKQYAQIPSALSLRAATSLRVSLPPLVIARARRTAAFATACSGCSLHHRRCSASTRSGFCLAHSLAAQSGRRSRIFCMRRRDASLSLAFSSSVFGAARLAASTALISSALRA